MLDANYSMQLPKQYNKSFFFTPDSIGTLLLDANGAIVLPKQYNNSIYTPDYITIGHYC